MLARTARTGPRLVGHRYDRRTTTTTLFNSHVLPGGAAISLATGLLAFANSSSPTFVVSSLSPILFSSCQEQEQHADDANAIVNKATPDHVSAVTLARRITKAAITAETKMVDLIVPTLQATVRAARLVSTALSMVMDYEMAKWSHKLSIVTTDHGMDPINTNTNDGGGGDEQQQRKYWEAELERRELELEHWQLVYTGQKEVATSSASSSSSLKDDGTNSNYNPHETTEPEENHVQDLKRQQKQAMQDAARRLAHAEEELHRLGGESAKSQLHRRAAQRLLKLCHANGGAYIKVGQHLANLDYLIPPEYIEVLSTLLDEAPQSSEDDVRAVLQEDLGGTVEELFDQWDPIPIASASLAQVHVAYDKTTGQKLAVKVQHRGLQETSVGDILAVTTVVRLVDWLVTDFSFGWIAEELAPHLPRELDFVREGQNSERAAYYLQQYASGLDCIVPKVIWTQTTSRVLTMTFEEGFKATDTQAMEESGLDKAAVAKLVSSVFFSQCFLSGWVHCDPHTANVLLRKNKEGKPQMVLVDHGLYKEIDDDFRVRYAELWRALMLADLPGIKTSCHNLGVDRAYTLFAALLTARPFDEIMERSKTGSLSTPTTESSSSSSSTTRADSREDKAVIRGYAKAFFADIMSLLGAVPRPMLLLLKMNDCIRHINYALGSPTNTLVVAGRYANRAVYEHQLQQLYQQKRTNDMAKTTNLGWTIQLCQAWFEYTWVLLRIQFYDVGEWMIRQSWFVRFSGPKQLLWL